MSIKQVLIGRQVGGFLKRILHALAEWEASKSYPNTWAQTGSPNMTVKP